MSTTHQRNRKIRKYESTIRSKNPKTVVEYIKKGSECATETVAKLGHDGDVYLRKLVNAGLIEAILGHLEHSSRPFKECMAEIGGGGGGGYGDLASPSVWVNALLNLCPKKNNTLCLGVTITTIAERIGPLVDAMGNAEGREFFASKEYWAQTFDLFIKLIGNLTLNEQARVILQERYNGAVENIVVRALFLDSHGGPIRADVLAAEGRNGLVMIQNPAASALLELSDVPLNNHNNGTTTSPANKRRLQFLADIPVAPGAECTLAAGMFELLANAHEATKQENGYSDVHHVYRQLQIGLEGECFRSVGFSKSATCQLLIDMSKKNLERYPHLGATDVHSVQCSLLSSDPKAPEDDTVAAAVKRGVLELIMQWVVKTHGSDEILMRYADLVIETVGVASLFPKTNKVLQKRKESIVGQLRYLKQRGCAPPLAGKMQALLNKADLSQIDSLPGVTSRHQCRSCNVLLEVESIMRCAKCKNAVYCSRECQVRDWKHGGHKAQCKRMPSQELVEEKAGSSPSEIRRAGRMEENLSSSGNLLFPKNYEAILLQASLRGQRITDCVVVLRFTELLPTMVTMDPEEFFAMRTSPQESEQSMSDFERNRSNGAITMACVAVTPNGTAVLMKTVSPEYALHYMPSMADVAPEERWNMLQRDVEVRSQCPVGYLRKNREECDRVIQELMVADTDYSYSP